jgi:hypothetical protein
MYSGALRAGAFNVCQRFMAIDVGLALAEQIEVGSVQDIDRAGHCLGLSLAGPVIGALKFSACPGS